MMCIPPRLRAATSCAILLSAAAAASGQAAEWQDMRAAGPFVCRADFSLDEMQGLLDDLGQLQQDLIRALGVRPAEERIEIYLFQTQARYEAYLARYFAKVPYRRALYVKSGGPGMVLAYRSRQLEVDLRHECTHALLHASLPLVPLWLDEGLAEYFEVAPGKRAFGNPHLNAVRFGAFWGRVPRLRDLESKSDLSEMKGAEYRNAWAWVHFMLHGSSEAHDELVRFLADIQAGEPPGLLSQRLAGRIADVDSAWLGHFRKWKRR